MAARSVVAQACSDGAATFDDNTLQSPVASGAVDGEIFTVTITDVNGCTNTSTTTVSVNPLPTATLSSSDGDDEICAGESVTFTAGGGTSYEFFVNGGSVQGPGALNTYTTTGLADGDVVTVTVTDGNGCEDTHAGITMTVETITPPSISGPVTVCNPSTVTYSVSDPGGITFLWTVTNGTIVGSATNSTVDVLWNVAGPGTVSIDVTSAIGCTDSDSVVVDVSSTVETGNVQSSSSLTRR